MSKPLALRLAVLVGLLAASACAHEGGLDASGRETNRTTCEHRFDGPASPLAADLTPAIEIPKATPAGLVKTKRSASAKAAFRRVNSCPSTGDKSGPCPRYEVDHIVPLACGGVDEPSNMQWLTTESNRKKGAMGCGR